MNNNILPAENKKTYKILFPSPYEKWVGLAWLPFLFIFFLQRFLSETFANIIFVIFFLSIIFASIVVSVLRKKGTVELVGHNIIVQGPSGTENFTITPGMKFKSYSRGKDKRYIDITDETGQRTVKLCFPSWMAWVQFSGEVNKIRNGENPNPANDKKVPTLLSKQIENVKLPDFARTWQTRAASFIDTLEKQQIKIEGLDTKDNDGVIKSSNSAIKPNVQPDTFKTKNYNPSSQTGIDEGSGWGRLIVAVILGVIVYIVYSFFGK